MLLVCFMSPAFADANLENGVLIARTKCAHCHGVDGNARSTSFQPVPMLAGQPSVYLVQEMLRYANGMREDTSKRQAMSKALKLLDENGLADVAAYYEAQKRY